MTDAARWIIAVIAAIAIVAIVLFARGGAERGNPDASPPALVIESIA